MNAVKEATKVINKYAAWQSTNINTAIKYWVKEVIAFLLLEIVVTLVFIGVVALIRI